MPRRPKDRTRVFGKKLGQWIRLRQDGRWTTQLELPRADDGIRSRKDVYGASPEEVEEKGLVIRSRCQGGLSPGRARGTTGEALDDWLEGLRRLSYNTLRLYRYQAQHLKDEFGAIPIPKLTTRRLQQGFDRLAERFCESHVGHLRLRMLAALEPLVGRQFAVNPVAGVLVDSPGRSRARALSTPEAGAFLRECSGKHQEAACALMLLCGLRLGEVLGLRWEDVDMRRRTLRIEQQLLVVWRDGVREERFVDPKSESSQATIAIPARAVPILERQRARQAAWKLKAGPAWRNSGLVLTTPKGHPCSRSALESLVERRCTAAGVTLVTPHGLRHSTATVLLELDVHPKIVQATLRHSRFAITMDLYSHVSADLQARAAEAMDEGLPDRPIGPASGSDGSQTGQSAAEMLPLQKDQKADREPVHST